MKISRFVYRVGHRVSTKTVSPFPFCFLFKPQSHNPNPTTPHIKTHTNVAWRNARSRSGWSALDWIVRTCKLQNLNWIRTLCRASRKIRIGRHLGLNIPIYFSFRSTSFRRNFFAKCRYPQNTPKSWKNDRGTVFVSIIFVEPF